MFTLEDGVLALVFKCYLGDGRLEDNYEVTEAYVAASLTSNVWSRVPSQNRHHSMLNNEMGELLAVTECSVKTQPGIWLRCAVLPVSDVRKYVYCTRCRVAGEMLVPFLKTTTSKG